MTVADCVRSGVDVLGPGHPSWPFADDPEPPALLFVTGDRALVGRRPSVAIVGTRRCTSIGRRVAHQLGADLSASGVTVVSGLATGIDGAAHRGALGTSGSVVGVVATGLDRVYPARHQQLWADVGRAGALVSEAPLGVGPERWRFPARNRLIAALADVVVVVESHERGGALTTADEAALRGVPVLAVPGSVLSSASDGTNALLADGCGPARSAVDVLDLLGLIGPAPGPAPAPDAEPTGARPLQLTLDPLACTVVDEAAAGPVSLDSLVRTTGESVATVLETVQRLVGTGLVRLDGTRVSLP